MQHNPIVVCGSGIIALSAAIALHKYDKPVVILDKYKNDENRRRFLSISPFSKNFLESIDIWNKLRTEMINPIYAMKIYGDFYGKIEFSRIASELAFIIQETELRTALIKEIQLNKIEWINDEFDGFDSTNLITKKGKKIQGSLFIGADGAQSKIRDSANIFFKKDSYEETAVVGCVSVQKNMDNTSYQWFTRTYGILGLLPTSLSDLNQQKTVCFILSMPNRIFEKFNKLEKNKKRVTLNFYLNKITKGELGTLKIGNSFFNFPLIHGITEMISKKIVLVGDAAHCIHPLAGLGINIGFSDVRFLTNLINQTKCLFTVLTKYKFARLNSIICTHTVINLIHKIFSSNRVGMKLPSNFGMNILNSSVILKNMLVTLASDN